MADFDYYGADYGVEEGSRLGDALRGFGLANWAGAITSLGLTAGLAVWAVDLTFRDVSAVPVILALEGPMRIAPEEPGGVVAPFQGMALSDITSGGAAAPAPEQIVLAPPPVLLDAPAQSERIAAAVAVDEAPEASGPEIDLAEVDAPEVAAEPDAVPSEIAEAPVPEDGAIDFRSAIAAAVAEAQPGIATSVRPRPRPAARLAASTPIDAPAQLGGVAVASAGAPDRSLADAVLASGREIDASSLPAGTRVVQLGAYDGPDAARAAWGGLEARFADYLAGKSRMVELARSGGRDFWRLRAAGFADGAEARRFCAELVARDAECIPVTVR